MWFTHKSALRVIADFILQFKVQKMAETTIVNIKLTDEYDVYIGRAGHGHDGYFGNPYQLKPGMLRGATIKAFREYFYKRLEKDSEFKRRVLELKGKRLGCFCKQPYKDVPCHGDVYVEYLDKDNR